MSKKSTYKVRNWKDYNQSLINRGNLTVWVDDSAIEAWHAVEASGRKGRICTYSDEAIECALTLRSLLSFPLRQTQGFIIGLFKMLGLKLSVPTYSTLSRRGESLEVEIPRLNWTRPINVLIDASGLKVFGEGEWKMRTHGKDKRRTWRKIHIGIDRESQEIVAVTLTESNVHDSKETAALLSQIESVASVTGDKGYDNRNAHDPIAAKGAKAIIPPRSGAALKLKNLTWGDVERNRLVRENHLLGKNAWKTGSGYTKRVLVETAFCRYKKIIGPMLHSKKLSTQKTEVRLACKILNKRTHLGMPKSYKS
jgi:Transposase DDE domain